MKMKTWKLGYQNCSNFEKDKVNVVKATGKMLLLPGTEEEGDHDHGKEGHHHEYDPHVWLSPKRAIKMVENIRDSLSKRYPDKKATFQRTQQPTLRN